jgi:hypothetical protein
MYYFAALAGKRRGIKFDFELLYIGAMFHDIGLTAQHSSKSDRFEVDGANAARAFLRQHNIARQYIDTVWTAIALHTTPGIPQYMLVIQYQTYLAQAQSTEVAAKGAHAKAMVALDRATARTLEVNQVSIREAQNGCVSRPAGEFLTPKCHGPEWCGDGSTWDLN